MRSQNAFSRIIPPDKAQEIGKAMVTKLRRLIPRQLLKCPLQAAVGSRIVAREDIAALRKDVLPSVTEAISPVSESRWKAKEGKKKMKNIGPR